MFSITDGRLVAKRRPLIVNEQYKVFLSCLPLERLTLALALDPMRTHIPSKMAMRHRACEWKMSLCLLHLKILLRNIQLSLQKDVIHRDCRPSSFVA